jgi:hypothetical protein
MRSKVMNLMKVLNFSGAEVNEGEEGDEIPRATCNASG